MMLTFKIDSKMTKRLWELGNKIARSHIFLTTLSEEEKQAIHRYARISQIGASTRIENAVLTDAEINWLDTILGEDGRKTAFESQRTLIENKLSKDRERSIEEVAGCRAMLQLIYEQAHDFLPLSAAVIRGLHQELLRFYPKARSYIGKYKTTSNKVVETNRATKKQRVVFETADAGVITETAMSDLITWYNDTLPKEPWGLAVSCEFTFRFLAIHPFQDGNGRLGRGLFLLSLLQSPNRAVADLAPYLALDRQIEKHKEEYYTVLNKCSDGKFLTNPSRYHTEHFLHFMVKIFEESLDDIELYRNRFIAFTKLSPSGHKIMDCFKDQPEVRLQTKKVCEATKLPRRTVVNRLSQLVKNGFIQKYGQGAGVRYQLVF